MGVEKMKHDWKYYHHRISMKKQKFITAEDVAMSLVCLADVEALNPKPLCHHSYIPFKKNFKCSKCGKVIFVVPSNWHPPNGWAETEVDPTTYDIKSPVQNYPHKLTV